MKYCQRQFRVGELVVVLLRRNDGTKSALRVFYEDKPTTKN